MKPLLMAAVAGALVLACSPAPNPVLSPSPSASPVTVLRVECDEDVPSAPDTLGCQEAVTAALAALPPGQGPMLVAHVISYRPPKCSPLLLLCVTEPNTAIVDLTPVSGGLQRVNVTKANNGTTSASLWLFVAGIQWTDATPAPEPSPTAMSVPPGTPLCGPADLQASAGWQGATGSMAGGIAVTNTGRRTCVLDGPPTHVRLLSGGTVLNQVAYKAVKEPGPDSAGIPGPAVLRPGDMAGAFLEWSNWCGVMIPVVTAVEILLPGTGKILARPTSPGPGIGGTPRCDDGKAPSTLTVWSFSFVPPAPPEPQNLPAYVEITAPPAATAGAALSFTVLLTNIGGEDARLEPCPVYSENLVVGGVALKSPAEQSYLFNCAAIGPFIASGRTVALSMSYQVPANLSGTVELTWFVEPGGPFDSSTAVARTPLTIVGP